jgi:hypothetical protein
MARLQLSDEVLPMQAGRKGEGRWQALVREFAESGKPSASIERDPEDMVESVRVALYSAVKTVGLTGIIGVSRSEGEVRLFRRDGARAKAVKV